MDGDLAVGADDDRGGVHVPPAQRDGWVTVPSRSDVQKTGQTEYSKVKDNDLSGRSMVSACLAFGSMNRFI